MEVYQNDISEKYFIHIEDITTDNALFVTPSGKVKSLSCQLFTYSDDFCEEELLQNSMVTESQILSYKTYKENRKMDFVERVIRFIEEPHYPISDSDKKKFIQYLLKKIN